MIKVVQGYVDSEAPSVDVTISGAASKGSFVKNEEGDIEITIEDDVTDGDITIKLADENGSEYSGQLTGGEFQ